jgi:hypothetical protein
VVFAEVGGELMGCILANIGNVGMQACDGLTCMGAVLRAFLTTGFLPLSTLQLLKRMF